MINDVTLIQTLHLFKCHKRFDKIIKYQIHLNTWFNSFPQILILHKSSGSSIWYTFIWRKHTQVKLQYMQYMQLANKLFLHLILQNFQSMFTTWKNCMYYSQLFYDCPYCQHNCTLLANNCAICIDIKGRVPVDNKPILYFAIMPSDVNLARQDFCIRLS